jgi:MEMO1 family protein
MTQNIRMPMRAGSFYEGNAETCRKHARQLLDSVELPDDLPTAPTGGIVPHAGWAFSGAIAAETIVALQRGGQLGTVVLFGADHVGSVSMGEVYDQGVWRTPLGEVEVDADLAGEILGDSRLFRANPAAHAYEHSLEVQVPLLQMAKPEVKILPIAVPPDDIAVDIGASLGKVLAGRAEAVCVIGSTDLTHHGGHFGNWGGTGEEGVAWTESNDRRMLGLIERMEADEIVDEAQGNRNACGAGAIAATISACKAMGAESGRVLSYDNSYRIVHRRYGETRDDTTVGYASVVFA